MATPVTSGLILELDARNIVGLSDGDPVATWEDASAAGNDFTQATANIRPTYETNVVNGLPVVRFGADSHDFLATGNMFSGATAAEGFIVIAVNADPPAVGGDTGLWITGGSGATHYPWTSGTIFDSFADSQKSTGDPAQDLTAFHIYNPSSAAGAWSSRINNVQHFSTGTNTVSFSTTPRLGSSGSYRLRGDVAAFIVYSRVLTSQERDDVYTYLDETFVNPPAPPSAPTNPAAVALSDTEIRVTWDDVADETGYRVERSLNGSSGWSDVSGNLAADTVLYDDTGLTADTQYFYRVFAFNSGGDSPASATVNATTDAGGAANRMGGTGAIRRSPRTPR